MIERLVKNTTIYTMDSRRPVASALLVRGNRILAAGDDELERMAARDTIIEDMQGATIVPGMVDCHIHWEMTALMYRRVDLAYITSKAATLEKVRDAAQKSEKGAWLLGRGWGQGDWKDTGGEFPTAADLDAIVPGSPAFFPARSGHAAWVNSEAMRRANITRDTADPPGGSIQRDAQGNPTGILFEEAIGLVSQAIPRPTPEEICSAMEEAQEDAWRQGLTGIHDYDGPSAFEALQILRERDRLGLRVVKNINDPYIHHAHELKLRWGFGDEWLRIGGLKMFADGALGSVTCLMIEPFEGQPDNRGIRVMEKQRMLELALEATRLGFPSTVHAIGDLAVREVLDVLEQVREYEAKHNIARDARRHRIEHVQLVHPDDQARLAQLDVIASMQPIHGTADIEMAERYWGDRARRGYNPRLQIDHGARVVFGSDAPVEPFAPLKTIHAAVARRREDGAPGPEGWYPEAKVTVGEALGAYTTEAAYAGGTEKILGRLAPGYLADLVALESDPHKVEPHALKDIAVLGTMVDGIWRWRA